MKTRCLNSNSIAYPDYGGRGITICPQWIDSFETFFADMGLKPSSEYSIERKDVNLGYTPDNCKWATKIEQENNKRDSRFITHEGITQTLSQWARQTGIRGKTISGRLEWGWSITDALTTPVRGRRCGKLLA